MSGEGRGTRQGSPGTLTPGERAAQYATFAAIAISGVLLAWWKYATPPPDDPFQAFAHPWLPHALHAHVLAAPLWVLAIGWILREHVIARWRSAVHRRGRYSGATAAILLLPMAASGYLLQTVTSEGWRRACVWIHVASGLGYAVAFLAHAVIGRRASLRIARSREGERGSPPAEHVRLRASSRRP